MKTLHIGMYHVGLPAGLPETGIDYGGGFDPHLERLRDLCPRIKAAGFDALIVEVRTPLMVDDFAGNLAVCARGHGLRFGIGWQLHDAASVNDDGVIVASGIRDTKHPGLLPLFKATFDKFNTTCHPVLERICRYSDLTLLNSEGLCSEFMAKGVTAANVGTAIANLPTPSLWRGMHTIAYHPDRGQSSSGQWGKDAHAAWRTIAKHHPWQSYAETANELALKPGETYFRNPLAAQPKYGMPESDIVTWNKPNDLCISVTGQGDYIERMLAKMGA